MKCTCALFVSHSKYVSMASFCFSPDGKSSFITCSINQAPSQVTLNSVIGGCFSSKLNTLIFILILRLIGLVWSWTQNNSVTAKQQLSLMHVSSQKTKCRRIWLMAQLVIPSFGIVAQVKGIQVT